MDFDCRSNYFATETICFFVNRCISRENFLQKTAKETKVGIESVTSRYLRFLVLDFLVFPTTEFLQKMAKGKQRLEWDWQPLRYLRFLLLDLRRSEGISTEDSEGNEGWSCCHGSSSSLSA